MQSRKAIPGRPRHDNSSHSATPHQAGRRLLTILAAMPQEPRRGVAPDAARQGVCRGGVGGAVVAKVMTPASSSMFLADTREGCKTLSTASSFSRRLVTGLAGCARRCGDESRPALMQGRGSIALSEELRITWGRMFRRRSHRQVATDVDRRCRRRWRHHSRGFPHGALIGSTDIWRESRQSGVFPAAGTPEWSAPDCDPFPREDSPIALRRQRLANRKPLQRRQAIHRLRLPGCLPRVERT